MHTNQGDIRLELDEINAPATTANFVRYAQAGFYDNTIFHRVIDGFMIQGGGYDTNLNHKATEAPIANEAHNGLKNTRGTIAMARTNDPHSATSQFFINLVDNDYLNAADGQHGYAVFGKVSEGMNVVDKIAKTPVTSMRSVGEHVPQEAIIIESVEVLPTEPQPSKN
ncbi:MAG: peptidylprolyl isomerase [Cardiobacteriaceae bacterium]|nr:peptidylprolyl isomerase [Cardiobacteriaceae bacterium]